MADYDRELAYHHSDHLLDWVDRRPELSDDILLELAYAISEWVITVFGPCMWIGLILLFLLAEFGH
jgi:hypothetical protein